LTRSFFDKEHPMSADDGVVIEKRGTTLVLTMSNPGRRNAFYPEMRARMIDALRDAAHDADVRAVVLTGADGHFCSGADLVRAAAVRNSGARTVISAREALKEVHRLLRVIVGGARPVIAAVEGDAFGAGLSMAAASDRVFAATNARFGAAFSKIGIFPDMGMLYTLPLRVGTANARHLMMLGAPIDGEHAHRLGLVDELAPPGRALDKALAYAAQFADIAPIPVTLIKAALNSGINCVEDAMRFELDCQPLLTSSADAQEGIAAFREKRKPRFTGM